MEPLEGEETALQRPQSREEKRQEGKYLFQTNQVLQQPQQMGQGGQNVLSHRRLISESRLEFLMEAATLTTKNLDVLDSNWETNYANLFTLLKNSSLITQDTLSNYTQESMPILNKITQLLTEQKVPQPTRLKQSLSAIVSYYYQRFKTMRKSYYPLWIK